MRRVLLAVAVLLIATSSPAFAGYLILRVLLEGGGAPAAGGPGGPGMLPGVGGPPPGPMGGRPPGPGRPVVGVGGMPPGPGMPGPGAPGAAGAPTEADHTRSVVVLIPLETDLRELVLDKSKNPNHLTNPKFKRLTVPYYGRTLQASLFVDSSSIQLYEELIAQPGPRKTRGTEMRAKYDAWHQSKSEPRLLYEAFVLALESGFIRDLIPSKDGTPPKDALHFAQELLDVAAQKKLTLPPDAQRFVAAWEQMSKAVTGPANQPNDAETWRAQLDAKNVRTEGHYSVVYWDNPETEVARRLVQLNDHFAAFFMWHATQGVVLPVPDKPLVTVLASQVGEMGRLRLVLDGQEGLPSQSDAFYSPDHNLVVLSPERMDEIGQTFLRQNQQLFNKGLSRDRLLAGEIPKIDPTGQKGSPPDDVARATTVALVEKLAIQEAELAAVTREGSRQLMYTTGVLPRHVTLPHWLTQGALNVFTRPRGPAYVTKGDDDKPYMSVAFTTGYGPANYVLQRYLRDLEDHNELNPDAARLLENVLTDAYFAGLKDGIDPDPAPPKKVKKQPAAGAGTGPGGPPPGPAGFPGVGMPPPMPGAVGPGAPGAVGTEEEDPLVTQRRKRDRLNIKSQTTAWALYHYLANARAGELKAYVAELNKLPRDLPIDGRTAYTAFVRVFKLSTGEDGPADPKLMTKFANDWLAYMKTVPAPWIDVPLTDPEPPKAGPGGPMGPMGIAPPRPGGP